MPVSDPLIGIASVEGRGACIFASSRHRARQRVATAIPCFIRLNATGDVDSARRALDGLPDATKSFTRRHGYRRRRAAGWIGTWVYLDVIERRFTDAFQAFEKNFGSDDRAHLRQLAGRVALHVLAGQTESAKSAGKEALPVFEATLNERPDDTFAMTGLSWVYFALGRNADALRLSKRAADTVPPKKMLCLVRVSRSGLHKLRREPVHPKRPLRGFDVYSPFLRAT